MKKLYVLDVSGFLFRAYFALPPMTNARGESTHALFGFIRSVVKLFKDFGPDHVAAVFDGPDNKKQRLEIYEKYKANRTAQYEDLPEQMELAKQFCMLLGIPYLEVPGVEADDTMGSIALWAADQGAQVFLCTSDKDLCQLVTDRIHLINPWKENLVIDREKVEEIYGVPPEQIIDLLAIMGDSSDNIPGLKGFGPKTAVALLKEFGSLDAILAHPEKVKGEKKQETLREEAETARLSRRLATIHTDIPFEQTAEFFTRSKPDIPKLRTFYQEMGFSSLLRELEESLGEKGADDKVSYTLVDDEEGLNQLLEKLRSASEIAFDLEATHLRPLQAYPVGVGFCIEPKVAFYVPFIGALGEKRVIEALKPLFENPSFKFFAHNAKYDCHVLANVGISVATVSFDTILASYLLNSGTRRHSLDNLSLHYFGKVKTPIKDLIGSGKKEITMDKVPIAKVSDYCCEDVDYTFRLKQIFAPELKKRGLESLLYDLELPLGKVLLHMERVGMFLETGKLEALSKEVNQELSELETSIYSLAGEEFNINSPKQLGVILFEKMGIKPLKKTATGPSTRAEVLEVLAESEPIAQKLLDYRSLEKLRSTYIETLPLEIDPDTHRIHPTFNQFIAATGRLACQDPNLQNIPVRTATGRRIREAFRPEKEGNWFLAADYSQIELRLLAHLSEDPDLIHAFKHGEDIHAFTASQIFDVPLSQVSPSQRYQAKAINFGIIYGQQAYGLSQEIGIDMKKAAAFIEAYFKRYPRVSSFIAECIEQARSTGRSSTMTGREREIPEIHSNNAILRNAAERLAVNTPLQGSAADLIKLAMLKIEARLEKEKRTSRMVLQIHDELIFEVPQEELESVKKIVKEEMEQVFALKVPLVVDLVVGKNWAEC